ncbi:DUF3124 domain-containing protein [Desulfobacca acetoxidans]
MNRLQRVLLTGGFTLTALFYCLNFPAEAVKLVKGQTIYIPSYANIISGVQRIILKANLVIHNSDPAHPITIVKIDHYDTKGQLVEKYLTQPATLNPLGALRVVIKEPRHDNEGAGANFIVQWRAEYKVTQPLLECIMVGSAGTQGFCFSSSGRIIQEEIDEGIGGK